MGAYKKVREIAMKCDQVLNRINIEVQQRQPANQVLQENLGKIRIRINHTLDGIIGHYPLES
ncbi:MAG: hypothetical protein NPIRA03_04310 [Nitrospirales bacterium]|nr:MAG: hypothetical protein NPIRA03_04310 [Nitrospirales bacterium]